MRQALLTILLMTLLPVAAADGPSASVATLTHDGGCSSESSNDGWWYGGWYDNGTRYYESRQSQSAYESACDAHAATLEAHAGDAAGPLADARVYQENGSSTSDQHNDWSYANWGPNDGSWSSGYDAWSRYERSEERGARVDALGATAGQASGCSSRSTYNASSGGSSSYWYDPYWGSGSSSSSSSGRSSHAHESGCADGADASLSGHGASAASGNGCASAGDAAHDQYSSSYSDSWYGESRASQSEAESCRSGLRANAEGSALFAGRDDSCARTNHSYERASGWSGGNAYESSSFGSSDCFHGYVVDGPDGMRFTAGNASRSTEWCQQGTCESQGREVQAVTWSWGSSPIAFLAQGEWDSPVWIPALA